MNSDPEGIDGKVPRAYKKKGVYQGPKWVKRVLKKG